MSKGPQGQLLQVPAPGLLRRGGPHGPRMKPPLLRLPLVPWLAALASNGTPANRQFIKDDSFFAPQTWSYKSRSICHASAERCGGHQGSLLGCNRQGVPQQETKPAASLGTCTSATVEASFSPSHLS